jgi:predicted GNAT superfamily acetyltransferase
VRAHENVVKEQREFNHNAQALGFDTSCVIALNRLFNLERRLSKAHELRHAFNKFMSEYLSLGYMKAEQRLGEYFIPHYAVVKRNEKSYTSFFRLDRLRDDP